MNLDPPPSVVKLTDDVLADSIWKTWFNNLHQFALFSGNFATPVLVTTSDSPYAVSGNEFVILCNPDTGNITVDLPAGQDGRNYIIKNYATSNTYNVSVVPNGIEEIEGSTSFVLSRTESINIIYIASRTGWFIL